MKRNLIAAACAAVAFAVAAPVVAQADSISDVENARAKDRQGRYLSRHDREQLRRYGGNDDYYYGRRYYHGGYGDYGYYGGSGVGVYVGPGGIGVYGD